jgi:hypothetical protein
MPTQLRAKATVESLEAYIRKYRPDLVSGIEVGVGWSALLHKEDAYASLLAHSYDLVLGEINPGKLYFHPSLTEKLGSVTRRILHKNLAKTDMLLKSAMGVIDCTLDPVDANEQLLRLTEEVSFKQSPAVYAVAVEHLGSFRGLDKEQLYRRPLFNGFTFNPFG